MNSFSYHFQFIVVAIYLLYCQSSMTEFAVGHCLSNLVAIKGEIRSVDTFLYLLLYVCCHWLLLFAIVHTLKWEPQMSGLLEMSIRNVRFALELKISLACISFYRPTVIMKTSKMNFANNRLTNLRFFIQISVAFKVSW